MSDWEMVALGELGTFSGGVTSIKREDYGFGTPFLTYKNVYSNWRVSTEELELMNVPQKDLDRKDCRYGDVFFTASSETEDEVAMSSVLLENVPQLTFNGFCKRFRPHSFDRLIPSFAVYWFRTRRFRGEVYQVVNGDTRFNINQAALAGISMPLPSIAEQEAIAEVLSSLDDKVDLLKRQNKTLEGMAEALFRQWFIVLEKENVETWKKLSQVTVKITDGTHSTVRDDPDGSFFLLSAKNIKDGQVVTGNSERRISEETLNSLRKRTQTQKGDVLLTTVGTIGESTVLHEAPNFELQRSVAIIRVNKVDITPNFLFQFMQTRLFMHEVDSRVEGSVQKCLFLNAIGDIEVPIPTNKKLEAFDSSIGLFRSKITNNQRSIVRLEAKRDTLLPKLMSGEVRVQMD